MALILGREPIAMYLELLRSEIVRLALGPIKGSVCPEVAPTKIVVPVALQAMVTVEVA